MMCVELNKAISFNRKHMHVWSCSGLLHLDVQPCTVLIKCSQCNDECFGWIVGTVPELNQVLVAAPVLPDLQMLTMASREELVYL